MKKDFSGFEDLIGYYERELEGDEYPESTREKLSGTGRNKLLSDFHAYAIQSNARLWEMSLHVETVLRNTLISLISEHYEEINSTQKKDTLIPWWLIAFEFNDAQGILPKNRADLFKAIFDTEETKANQSQNAEHPSQGRDFQETTQTIEDYLRSFSLGKWTRFITTENSKDGFKKVFENLIRKKLKLSEEECKELANNLKQFNQLRNAIAHHNRLKPIRYTEYISLCERLLKTLNEDYLNSFKDIFNFKRNIRPEFLPRKQIDTVIVPARVAYDIYLEAGIYACQEERYFHPDVQYLAFYTNNAIKPEVCQILDRQHFTLGDDEKWREELRNIDSAYKKQWEKAISHITKEDFATNTAQGWGTDRYLVFLLAHKTFHRNSPIPLMAGSKSAGISHEYRGPGKAFVRKQRYFHHDDLIKAEDTDDLVTLRQEREASYSEQDQAS